MQAERGIDEKKAGQAPAEEISTELLEKIGRLYPNIRPRRSNDAPYFTAVKELIRTRIDSGT